MNKRIGKHVFFWVGVTFFLTIYFGRVSDNFVQAFYFTTFLLPVALATSYFFNYFLVPHFLITKRYWKFGLYFIYTLIFSLYLEMLVMTLSFIVLANYQYDQMNPLTVDIFTLTITLYSIVLLIAFVRMVNSFQTSLGSQKLMEHEIAKNKISYLNVKSNREIIPIPLNGITYIESLADYVKIHTPDKAIITKERISQIQIALPSEFVRIHRSFIVNKNMIDSFSKEKIKVNGIEIPISRTYKMGVIKALEIGI